MGDREDQRKTNDTKEIPDMSDSKMWNRRTLLATLGITGAALAAGGSFLNRVSAIESVSDAVYGSAMRKSKPRDLMNWEYCLAVSIQQLRSEWNPLPEFVYFVTDHGKEGAFVYEPDDTISEDNGGTVLVSEGGARFIRIYSEEVNVTWFGALGDGATDDTLSIQAALDTGKNVFVPEGNFRISNTLVMRTKGQRFRGASKYAAKIFNNSSAARLLSVGDTTMPLGHAEYAAVCDLHFEGNNATLAGVSLHGKRSTGGIMQHASKNVYISNLTINNVGNGTAFQVFTWSNTIIGLTLYTGNRIGVMTRLESNANTWSNIYITGCRDQSIIIGGGGDTQGNFFNGVVVQQSGGPKGCVEISNSHNTYFHGIYSEVNDKKGAPCVIYVDKTARNTVIRNVNNSLGGRTIVTNAGVGTTIDGIVSERIEGPIVQITGSDAITWTSNLSFKDGMTGELYADHSSNGKSVFLDANVLAAPVLSIDGQLRPLTDQTVSLGSASKRWRSLYTAANTITAADESSTGDITDETLGLEFIKKLRPRSFTRSHEETGSKHHGFIAQELKNVLDEIGANHAALVADNVVNDNGVPTGEVRYGLRYGEFIGHLTLAIQQLAEKVERLENVSGE